MCIGSPSLGHPIPSLVLIRVLVLVVSLLLSGLSCASPIALNAIISFSYTALLFSYILSIGAIRL